MVVGLWGAASGTELLGKHRRGILRLRLGGGMRADAVGLWGAASHEGLLEEHNSAGWNGWGWKASRKHLK